MDLFSDAIGSLCFSAALATFGTSFAHAGDVAFGAYLAAECITCHQLSGRHTGGVPPIVGLPEERFIDALRAYKTGKRDNEVMRNIASRLTTEEISALAAYFAAQEPEQ